jgi:hypothetical protein
MIPRAGSTCFYIVDRLCLDSDCALEKIIHCMAFGWKEWKGKGRGMCYDLVESEEGEQYIDCLGDGDIRIYEI